MSRRRLTRPRVQVKIVTTRDNFADDIERLLLKYENVVPGKKPLILSEIHESSDFSYFREKIKDFSDRAIFRRPLLIKESAPSVRISEQFDRRSLFVDYFRGDAKMADLALTAYSITSNEPKEPAKEAILQRILERRSEGADQEP